MANFISDPWTRGRAFDASQCHSESSRTRRRDAEALPSCSVIVRPLAPVRPGPRASQTSGEGLRPGGRLRGCLSRDRGSKVNNRVHARLTRQHRSPGHRVESGRRLLGGRRQWGGPEPGVGRSGAVRRRAGRERAIACRPLLPFLPHQLFFFEKLHIILPYLQQAPGQHRPLRSLPTRRPSTRIHSPDVMAGPTVVRAASPLHAHSTRPAMLEPHH